MPAVNFILQEGGLTSPIFPAMGPTGGVSTLWLRMPPCVEQYHRAQDPALPGHGRGFIGGKVLRAGGAAPDPYGGFSWTCCGAMKGLPQRRFQAFRVLLKYDLGFHARIHHRQTLSMCTHKPGLRPALQPDVRCHQHRRSRSLSGLFPGPSPSHRPGLRSHGEWRTLLVDSIVLGMINH